MKRTRLQFLAAASIAATLFLAAARVESARRPRYGGTLRVEMQEAVLSLDPGEWSNQPADFSAKQNLMSLAFDRVTRLDAEGHVQPALAISWEHDASFKAWTFFLRANVRLHDGSSLSSEDVATALREAGFEWRISGTAVQNITPQANRVVIQTVAAAPDLPVLLASSRCPIYRRRADGNLIGTGPFRFVGWQPDRRAVFAAFEDNWEGRPYLDSIEVQMGRAPGDQLIDLELGKADLIEIPPEQVRRTADRGARVWTSQPTELLAVVFTAARPASEDAHLREALARSIDRGALANFLLQKQGEPAGGLLPQSLSGYAFLFPPVPDPARARELFHQISPVPPPLVLGYDASDPLERSVAERIAVNARDAGIIVNVKPLANSAVDADARLERVRIDWPDPRTTLETMELMIRSHGNPLRLPIIGSSPEEMYAAERAIIDSFRLIPLLHLPQAYCLSAQVRNWMPASVAAGGDWRLADVWLDSPAGDSR